nr:hypothetical protein [Tanacetum cinerariifolium]
MEANFGPTLFKLFNSWLKHKDFLQLLLNSWNTMSLNPISNQPAIYFKSRLQRLKYDIKQWCRNLKEFKSLITEELRKKIDCLDIKAETAFLTEDGIIARTHNVKALADLEHGKFMDLNQKAKIYWALESDENSRFFYGIINCRLNHSRINGLNIQGHWVSDPMSIKNHIFNHFDWSLSDAKNLSRILTCFHLASGLKVNFNKRKLFSIEVTDNEINIIAFSIGCLAFHFPCLYLGLPIGATMSISINWIPLVERFQKRLSKWKVNSLFFGGRLTLIKSVLCSLGVCYFSTFKAPKKIVNKLEGIRRRFFSGVNVDEDKFLWIAWNKVVSPQKNGGLGIVSLMESNQSLWAKWWWRFRVEENTIWCKVVRSIHGPTGGMLNPLILSKRRAWRRSPCSLAERLKLTDIQNLLTNLHLSMDQNSWEFTQDSTRIFLVNSMRKTISNASVDPTSQQMRWNKLLPSKVNILAWRIANKRLPTMANLDKRGIDLDSVLCSMCNNDIETESHILVSCPNPYGKTFLLGGRFQILIEVLLRMSFFGRSCTFGQRLTIFFDVTVNTTMWSFWNYRNKVIFNLKRPQKELINSK